MKIVFLLMRETKSGLNFHFEGSLYHYLKKDLTFKIRPFGHKLQLPSSALNLQIRHGHCIAQIATPSGTSTSRQSPIENSSTYSVLLRVILLKYSGAEMRGVIFQKNPRTKFPLPFDRCQLSQYEQFT